MENFTHHCASLRSSSSRLINLALASTFLASIFFLTLKFSPSFLTLLLLIPSSLFLSKKLKYDSNRSSIGAQELASDGECSSNGGLGTGGFEIDSDLRMCSDDSSSEDDDSLIEIVLLPKSNAIRTDSKIGGGGGGGIRNLDSCLPDLLPDSVLRQRVLLELLEEINEEENLIEIDISRGFDRDFSLFGVEGSDSGAKSEFNRQCLVEQSVV